MKTRILFILWGVLFALCAALGFIPAPEGLVKALLVLAAMVFFVPGIWLAARAVKTQDRKLLYLLRNLSMASLIATLMLLVANFLFVTAPQWMGDLFYGVLVIVSTPMVCSQFWASSMFVWACLLFFTLFQLKDIPTEKKKKKK